MSAQTPLLPGTRVLRHRFLDTRCRWLINIGFNPRYMWLGIGWRYINFTTGGALDVDVCVVPFFPIHIRYWRAFRTSDPNEPKPEGAS